MNASWNPKGEELFFGTQRERAPKIWSMRPGRPAISIQLPLTRYRPEGIVQMHSMSALADGKAHAPAGSSIFYYRLEPGAPREGFFIGSGEDEFPTPAGPLRLTALKGIEHRIQDRTVDVTANDTASITIQMERWTNWAQRG